MPLYTGWLLLASGEGGGSHLLDPGKGLSFWTVVTFCVVMIVLKKYAWGPIQQQLDAREEKIRGGLAAAEDAKKEAARIAKEHEGHLEERRRESEKILEEARADAKGIIDRAHKEAVVETEALKARAMHEIELAKDKATEEIQQTAVKLVMGAAEKLLERSVDTADNQRMVEQDLARLGGRG